MENRSFDNMFRGFPGANTVSSGRGHLGRTIVLAPVPFEGPCDPDHSHESWVKEYDGGKMDGFDKVPASCIGVAPSSAYPYDYLPYAEVKPYWDIARQFSVADNMFASQTGPSYRGHMFIIAGTSGKPNRRSVERSDLRLRFARRYDGSVSRCARQYRRHPISVLV